LAEKMRVHILAKELNVTSKAILVKCQAEGLNVKNHMSTLTAGQEATLREWFSEGVHETTVEVADRVNLLKVRPPRRRKLKAAKAVAKEVAASTAVELEPAAVGAEPSAGAEALAPPEVEPRAPEAAVAEAPPPRVEAPAPAERPAEAEAPAAPPFAEPSVEELTPVAAEAPAEPTEIPAVLTPAAEAPAEIVAEAEVLSGAEAPAAPMEVRPAGPQNVPTPARLRGPRVVRYEAPETTFAPGFRGRAREPEEAPGDRPAVEAPSRRGRERRGPEVREQPAVKRVPGRRGGRGYEAGDLIREWRDRDLIERQERLAGATGRRIHTRRLEVQRGPAIRAEPPERKTKASVQEPIQLKDLCAAIGEPFLSVFNVLKRDHHMLCNVNSVIQKDVAELVAAEFEVELTVIEAKTSLDELHEEFEARERAHPQPRPPVVTLLGHVDHGKTTLLDAIRRTTVAAHEDGGITQHIGAYQLTTPSGRITFVDTPGHQAFTSMRARGARLTDIVILVVAIDDGVMPQTIEAINHARAADVPIVVALNKIDLGRSREVEVFGELAARGLAPSGEWGGQTDVIRTSALTGEGIPELLEHLVAFGEVMELQADPDVDGQGTVIEAETKEGVGPVVRVLVQEGTLRKGDIVVCGNAAGKVRALRDDRGRAIDAAGPSLPVEVWGLEDVPQAGDKLYVVQSMQRAKEISLEVTQHRLAEARIQSRKVRSLEELFKQRDADEAPELNVIIKADVDGSVDVLKHALSQIPTDQVKLSIRHGGVGAVNDSDVALAEASSAIIIAFRVTTQTGAKKLAEASQVDIRNYRVVYEVIDDIIRAMEGKLPPEEKQEPRGTAEVRLLFKLRKVGWVAGCMVTDGVVSRNHFARVVRDGTIVRDRCRIDSLRHFKDDVKEVRAGLECGIRLEAFDDVKQGDVIESYEVVQVARTL
jgi:translation initiation factor IF-2